MLKRGRWQEVWRRKGMARSGQTQVTPPITPPPAFDQVVTDGGVNDVVTNGSDKVSTNN
jgi:hypothetical protein